MKFLLVLLSFLLLSNCASSKKVYWCGDHPCINNNEKQDYFKKNMVVEVKYIDKKNNANNAEVDNIIVDARLSEKKRIREEKKLAKQIILDEKKRIREEKKLAEQVTLDKKKRIREEKKLAEQGNEGEKLFLDKEKNTEKSSAKVSLNSFKKIMESIAEKNKLKPYPDINSIKR